MKLRVILWLALSALLLGYGCATSDHQAPTGPAPVTGTPISGALSGVLSAADSPYRVTGDLTVPAGESLVIEHGVELRFDGLYMFLVQGHLEALGTADDNIIFTSGQGSLGNGDFGQWRALVFDTGADTSILQYCQVKFGAVWDSTVRYPDSTGLWVNGAIYCWNSSPIIRNCNIVMNGYHGIYCIGSQSKPYILNNLIYENDGDGIRCEPIPGQAVKAEPEIWYNDSKENNARQYAEAPDGIGERTRINDNGDSTDFQFNMSLDPLFEDFAMQDYRLHPCSPCIVAGLSGATIGSIPYYVGATELRGDAGGRVITAAGNPWTVSCDIFVNPGETLTIEPGSRLLFEGIYGMHISGKLEAEGATFIPRDSANAAIKWLGILLDENADPNSYIRNCRFVNTSTTLNGEPYGGAITVQGISLDISENTFEGMQFAAVSCQYRAQPIIADNVINGYGTMAINCFDNSHPSIHHNKIFNGLGYGILCDFTSSPLIEANLIYDNLHIGIKCENQSSPIVQYNTIALNAYAGIVCSLQSNPLIKNNIVAFNGSPVTWADSAYGNGVTAQNSSFPQLAYNDVYQEQGALYNGEMLSAGGPDSTNISSDPLFVNATAGNFHLQANSPALTAAEDGGQVGAYGQGEW